MRGKSVGHEGPLTITLTPCTRVEIRGDYGGRPALLAWMTDQDIWPVNLGGSSGSYFFIGLFKADDAEKIREYINAVKGGT